MKMLIKNETDIKLAKNKLNTIKPETKDGKRIIYYFELKKHIKPRSNSLNRYYWGIIIPMLCEHTGYIQQEMHAILKDVFIDEKFSRIEIIYRNRTKYEFMVKSTAELNNVEFNEYCEKIRLWAIDSLNFYIPLPNEVPDELYIRYM